MQNINQEVVPFIVSSCIQVPYNGIRKIIHEKLKKNLMNIFIVEFLCRVLFPSKNRLLECPDFSRALEFNKIFRLSSDDF